MSTPKISMTTETITPKMAESWLELNKDNRPMRDHHVKMLAKEMREGRWHLNGEAIVFDWDGKLLDGQHRLWAAYEYEQTFETAVVRGVDPAAFKTIDSGLKRSAGDVLAKADVPYGVLTAAAVRLIHFYETGRRDYNVINRMSNAETLDLVKTYPRVVDAVALVGPRSDIKRVMPNTSVAAFVYLALEDDRAKTEEFLEALATGADLKRSDPRLVCRNLFTNLKQRGSRPMARVLS